MPRTNGKQPPRTVVVVNAGAPWLMPWAHEPAALLWSWFPGQEGGDAIADVLTGAEPGGRLPTTFPAAEADVPVLSTEPVDGVLDYAEGDRIGYRAYRPEGVLFPFGDPAVKVAPHFFDRDPHRTGNWPMVAVTGGVPEFFPLRFVTVIQAQRVLIGHETALGGEVGLVAGDGRDADFVDEAPKRLRLIVTVGPADAEILCGREKRLLQLN